jgi:hypothetical protein
MPLSRSAARAVWDSGARSQYREALSAAKGAESACVTVSGDQVTYSKSCFSNALKPIAGKLSAAWAD